jgi:hypothetical protein
VCPVVTVGWSETMALQRMSGPLQLALGPAVISHPSIAASLVASAEASSDYTFCSNAIPPPTSKPTSVMCSPLLSGFVCAGACACNAAHAPWWRGLHFFTAPLSLVPSQSEVRLPERLSTEDEGVLVTMRGQLREGQYKDAVATFLTERDVHPDSPLCAG